MIDYHVQLINFPNGKTKEVVTENEDGSYTIFIEENLSQSERQKEFLHAMYHIIAEDFTKFDIQKIEKFSHDKCRNVIENMIIDNILRKKI